nr:hypothetical protein [uncultured Campylobacter sp.]
MGYKGVKPAATLSASLTLACYWFYELSASLLLATGFMSLAQASCLLLVL